MSSFYTDRAAVNIGGTDVPNVVSVTFTVDHEVTPVSGMTPDYSIPGFVRGNQKITMAVTENIANKSTLINYFGLDCEAVNVIITIQGASASYPPAGGGGIPFNGTAFTLTNCVYMSEDADYGGEGQVATRTSHWMAQYIVELPASGT